MLFFQRKSAISSVQIWSIIISCIFGISSCTIEKQYHSWGWKISSTKLSSANTRDLGNSNQDYTYTHTKNRPSQIDNYNKNSTTTSASQAHQIKNRAQTIGSIFLNNENSSNSAAQKYNSEKPNNLLGNTIEKWLAKPLDTVFFPEKYQHRKHGTLYLPQIKNEDEFNTATAFANLKDVSAWNWFDRGHISAKTALYWLFGFIAMIIIIGLGNISLAGIAVNTRKTITTILILVPAILFAIAYICYLLGTFSIWSANKLYKNALNKLPHDLKLKADAIIMHARIPYVSKGATLRHAKRILSSYPNDRNGEWLEDVSKTKREIETGRSSLTINNWSRMRTVGFISTLLIFAFLAIKFL